jgi:hypothetical protein
VRRIVILGMNNPLSNDPKFALYPAPEGCAGHRLWRMANARTGISRQSWVERTDRRNLCTGEWDKTGATIVARQLREELWDTEHAVLCMGSQVAHLMHVVEEPLMWARSATRNVPHVDARRHFVKIPHPSGRNLWYNNPVHRVAVEILLADLLYEDSLEDPPSVHETWEDTHKTDSVRWSALRESMRTLT